MNRDTPTKPGEIRVRGRNGWFTYRQHYAWSGSEAGGVELFSNSPHTRAAPVEIKGPPAEVVKLLRRMAREIQAEHRATLARISNPQGKAKT